MDKPLFEILGVGGPAISSPLENCVESHHDSMGPPTTFAGKDKGVETII
jgi:hypothetical protein